MFVGDEGFDPRVLSGATCAFGVFDGVHSAHRFLIDQARSDARERQTRAVALTFDIDPDELFRADSLRKLMSNEDRLRELSETGVDAVVAFRFSRAFASLSPEAFLERAFAGRVPSCIHVGQNFHFGSKASGGIAELTAWGSAHGMTVRAHDLLSLADMPVSATRIRALLQRGAIGEANQLLGRRFRIRGRVLPGRGEGRDMGFRTANLVVPQENRVLADGVYGAYAHVRGATYKAAVSVGVSLVFRDEATATCEVHLLDFSGDIYDEEIAVDFDTRIRPMIEFDSVEELIETVKSNIEWIRKNL